ncbi:MAG: L,D-transpeptidase/peptidoglycan binding protein [Clostridiales bacterium]|nr:L,D-transpeptidase/peptidoglycan binding protein [Clostridiales bacterium]
MENEEREQSGNRKKAVFAVGAALLVFAAAAYIGTAQRYTECFFPRTAVNHIDVSGLSISEVKTRIAEGIAGYTCRILTRTGEDELSGEAIGLRMEYDDSLEQEMAQQNPYLWGLHLLQDTEITMETMIVFDDDKMEEEIDGFAWLDESQMKEPVNAAISGYIEGTGYEIIPEEAGTKLDREAAIAALTAAIRALQPEISLEDAGVYAQAEITSENEELLARLEELNRYAAMTVVYRFGESEEILEGVEIQKWLTVAEDGTMSVDETAVAEYVKALAGKYDTAYQPKEFTTSYGDTVTITKGNYGWRISQKEETAALKEIILSGQGEEREPVYLQTAASHEGKDYGDTYVEVNLTAQHLYYYKDGELLVESDFVSGNESRGNGTPDGAYPITYKQRNAVLRGQGYASPVSYWMPFNRNIGMHDADWRSSFGGTIYRTNGSHGCINLPPAAAKTIYENIEAGTAVLCYHLGGTAAESVTTVASTGSSSSLSGNTSAAQPISSEVASAAENETAETADGTTESETAITQIGPQTDSTGESSGEPAQPTAGSNVIIAGQSAARRTEQTTPQETETSPVVVAGSGSQITGPGELTEPVAENLSGEIAGEESGT